MLMIQPVDTVDPFTYYNGLRRFPMKTLTVSFPNLPSLQDSMTSSGTSKNKEHSDSAFRIGENVEIARVLAIISILVVIIVILENRIHKWDHQLLPHPKHHEMMTKVLEELTIVGLLSFLVKIFKEIGRFDPENKKMIAFEAADMTIFIVAIALVLQAVIISFKLRRKNVQANQAELISTQHLADHINRTGLPTWRDHIASIFTYGRPRKVHELTKADIPEIIQLRILRYKFLTSFDLPQLFPFAKYLRQAQDNQITHMIEVKISTWMVLLLIAWGMEGISSWIHHQFDTEYSFALAFLLFAWGSVLVHVAVAVYLTYAIDTLVNMAADTPLTNAIRRYEYLRELAVVEMQAATCELATEAIARMERVREHEQSKEQASAPVIQLRGFSPKAWYVIVMSTLMPNGLYVALYCQCLIYQLTELGDHFGRVFVWMLLLPLLLNMCIFQPRILRNFILVSSIIRVDNKALSDVIGHFTETVHLRASFIERVYAYLDTTDQTIDDIQHEFEALDHAKTGYLDTDQVRRVLGHYGFELSYFRFTSVAHLLFVFQGIQIEYAQVLRLLELGKSHDIRALANENEPLLETPTMASKIRHSRPLLRATSTVARVLYRMLESQDEQPSSPNDHTHYVASVE